MVPIGYAKTDPAEEDTGAAAARHASAISEIMPAYLDDRAQYLGYRDSEGV